MCKIFVSFVQKSRWKAIKSGFAKVTKSQLSTCELMTPASPKSHKIPLETHERLALS